MTEPPTPPGRPVRPRRRRWLAAAILIAAGVVAWIIWGVPGARKAPTGSRGIPVAAQAAWRGNLDVTLEALGTATPVHTVTVASRVAGELIEVDYKQGREVRKGELLAVIDPRPYQAAVLQAEGQLEKDQATLKNAQVDLVRYQDAYRQHAVSEQQVATQQATVEQDEGATKVDRGNLDAANVNLAYTRIVSPIDGRVGLRLVDSGNLVPANGTTGIATVTQLQPMTVIFNLAEDDLDQFAGEGTTGKPLQVDALDRDLGKVLATGRLIAIDNQIDTATGTVKGRAVFDNRHNELFPNQFVNVRLHVRTLTGATLVPTAAIQRNGSAAFVYVIVGGKAVSHAVQIVQTEGDTSAVTGVNPGDLLVTDGFDRLQNGASVVVRKPAAAPAKAAAGTPAAPAA
ncbi:MAG: efflux RND transporter periplasmic adaptor subunit [Opitutaceae bacterium]